MDEYKKIELEHELNRLRNQKKVLLEATTYSTDMESRKAISDILIHTNEQISIINKELEDLMDKED